jgi:PAS domain-containing protein
MSIQTVSVIISHNSQVLEATDAFCDLLNHTKHEVESKLLLELIHPDDHRTAVKAFIDVFYSIHKPKRYTFRFLDAAGVAICTYAIVTLNDLELVPSASILLSLTD